MTGTRTQVTVTDRGTQTGPEIETGTEFVSGPEIGTEIGTETEIETKSGKGKGKGAQAGMPVSTTARREMTVGLPPEEMASAQAPTDTGIRISMTANGRGPRLRTSTGVVLQAFARQDEHG